MKNLFKKNVSILLIVAILFPSAFILSPQKARAVVPVGDVPNAPFHIYSSIMTAITKAIEFMSMSKELTLDPIAYAAARILIRQLTQSIVNWINSGFNGSPAFIQDPGGFLSNTADIAAGGIIAQLGLDDVLCTPFRIKIQMSLKNSRYTSTPLNDRINCRFSDVLKNVEDSYESFTNGDFITGGGWDSWMQISGMPQNNELGALFLAQEEVNAKINEVKKQAEKAVDWGKGFMSYKQCVFTVVNPSTGEMRDVEFEGDPTTYTGNFTEEIIDTNCTTITPGSLINSQLEEAVGSDLKQLQLADEFNEIVGALANYTIKSIMEGGGGLAGHNSRDDTGTGSNWRNEIARLEREEATAEYTTLQGKATQGLWANDAGRFMGEEPEPDADVVVLLARINSQIALETAFQTNVTHIKNILNDDRTTTTSSAYSAFADKLGCSGSGDIQAIVLDRITGVTEYGRGAERNLAGNENLNIVGLQEKLDIARSNISNLESNITIINSGGLTAILVNWIEDAIEKMHTTDDVSDYAVDGRLYNRIKAWLIARRNQTDGPGRACAADLTIWGIE